MNQKTLALSEIAQLEDTIALDAPVVERVVQALLERWAVPLRDAETATRLLYVLYDALTDSAVPEKRLTIPVPTLAQVLQEAGGDESLPADAQFAFGVFMQWQAWPFGDEAEWKDIGRRWAQRSAEREPTSRLFREWSFFLGDATTTIGPKIYILPEIHARYFGRGMFGAEMTSYFTSRLE